MHNRKIAVIGIGYVGLAVAMAFAKLSKVIAYDQDSDRISELSKGIDRNGEVTAAEFLAVKINFTNSAEVLNQADFYILTVPTPIDAAKQPDPSQLYAACSLVGSYLKAGDMVVFESTVYPGMTEEECIPILEQVSGLICGKDFYVGYSPERINPGDKEHNFTTTHKIIAAQNKEALGIITTVYTRVIKAGIYQTLSIKVAEAAKIIENIQRDLNVALINELAMLFHKLEIDTKSVLDAACTKWNFYNVKPGLVGGHCIGVDPYYLTYKAKILDYHPQLVLAGRRINDSMGKYVAEQTVKQLVKLGISPAGSKVAILGFTFKENCKDIRNTKVIDIYNELQEYEVEVLVHDPYDIAKEAKQHYGIELTAWSELIELRAIILAVAHEEYLAISAAEYAQKLLAPKLIIDVKSALDLTSLQDYKINLWRL